MSSRKHRRHTDRRDPQPHVGHTAAIERTLRILDDLARAATRHAATLQGAHSGTRKEGA